MLNKPTDTSVAYDDEHCYWKFTYLVVNCRQDCFVWCICLWNFSHLCSVTGSSRTFAFARTEDYFF